MIEIPWLTIGRIGGERINLVAAKHIMTAAFGENRLYSLTNYALQWVPFERERFSATGGWVVADQGLDIFDLGGRRLGSYRLPGLARPDWIRADLRGRMLVKSSGTLQVFEDPTFEGTKCPALPDTIVVTVSDTAPRHSASDFRSGGGEP